MTGANPERGEVLITLKGKEYPLKYTWSALRKLQQLTGKPIMEMAQNVGVGEIEQAIAVGLQHIDAKMTVKRLENKLDPKDFTHYVESVTNALLFALGLNDADESDETDSSASGGEQDTNPL